MRLARRRTPGYTTSMVGENKGPRILRVADREIPLVVSRHPRARHMTLRLDGSTGDVQLVLPQRTALAEGLDFAEERADWLLDQIEALPARVPFVIGAVIPVLGADHVIDLRPDARRGVWQADGRLWVSGRREHVARRVNDYLRTLARREIAARACAKAERIDRRVRRVTLRDMKSRWGSCSTDGRLCFSWRLVLAPAFVLDYVVAHEVAHLREMNHGRRFWRLAGQLTPEIARARAWLGEHGDGLLRYG